MGGQENTQLSNAKPVFFYGYVIVFATFFIMLIIAGTYYTFGVFLKPLSAEFGWSRAATSGAFTLSQFLMGFFSIIAGRLCDRFGSRIVATICGAILGLGLLLMSQTGALWQLYLFYGVLVAIGLAGCWGPLLATVARWFVRRRGLMSSIVISGMGFGTIIVPPIAVRLISSYGWRNAYIIIGIITLVLLVLPAQFLKHDPRQKGLSPYGNNVAERSSSASEAKGFSLSEAIQTGQFWLACAIYFCYGIFLVTTIVHIAPHATELGISPINAANIIAIIGGLSIIGRVAIGYASDRIGVKFSLALAFILVSIALLWLHIAKGLWMLYLFAAVFGFGYGGTITVQSPLLAELFGLRSHATILGVVICFATVSGAVGSLMGGVVFDVTGSYSLAFWICATVTITGFILTLFLRPVQDKQRHHSTP